MKYGIRTTAAVLPLLIGGWAISGCAVGLTRQAEGVEYRIEEIRSVRPGMAEEEVIKVLGRPYSRGTDLTGSPVLEYHYVVTTVSSMAAGFPVVGVTGSRSLSGGKARILLDPVTRTLKSVQYEIYGTELYEKLRGGLREEIE